MKSFFRKTVKLSSPVTSDERESSSSSSSSAAAAASSSSSSSSSSSFLKHDSVIVSLPQELHGTDHPPSFPFALSALPSGTVGDLLLVVLRSLDLPESFASFFQLKLVFSPTTGELLLCSHVTNAGVPLVQRLFACADCRVVQMCAVCRLVCHATHRTRPCVPADELVQPLDAPSRCYCGSGSDLRVQTNRGHACCALAASAEHVVLDASTSLLAASRRHQLAGRTVRLTFDFAPGVHSALAALTVERRRAALRGDIDVPVSPRTPRDALRNVHVDELQRALLADDVAAAAVAPPDAIVALLDKLWHQMTDSSVLKSARERATSEAVAWLDLDCALRRLKPTTTTTTTTKATSAIERLPLVVPEAYESVAEPQMRSNYVELDGIKVVLDSDRSAVVDDDPLPIPPPESTMMRMVQREKELRGDLTPANSDYRTIPVELSPMVTDLAEPATPRRRQGAVAEAQVRVDANTGHFWAALAVSDESRTPRLVFIPEKHRSIAKRGDWVVVELNAPRPDGRQTGKIVQVLANASGLPVIVVPPEQMPKPSAAAPHLSPVALALFEAGVDSCLHDIGLK